MSVDATQEQTSTASSGCGCSSHAQPAAAAALEETDTAQNPSLEHAPTHQHSHSGGGCGSGSGCGCGAQDNTPDSQPQGSDPSTHADASGAAKPTNDGPTVTEAASQKAKQLLAQEGRDDLVLRIAVAPGGCSGLRYQLVFDDQVNDDDIMRDFGGIRLAVDKMSAPYLTTSTIDFADTLEKSGFTIDNPAAQGSCSCGDSFH